MVTLRPLRSPDYGARQIMYIQSVMVAGCLTMLELNARYKARLTGSCLRFK